MIGLEYKNIVKSDMHHRHYLPTAVLGELYSTDGPSLAAISCCVSLLLSKYGPSFVFYETHLNFRFVLDSGSHI